MLKTLRTQIVSSMREIIFGLEDSLVSTLGTITGIAVGTDSRFVVILSGLVLIAVEATSMTAGSYLSTKSYEAAERASDKDGHRPRRQGEISPRRAASVMGVFYLVGGFVPLIPYLFLPIHSAFLPSIVMTVIALFALGVWSAKFTKRDRLRSGLEMLFISMAAASIGYFIGTFVRDTFSVSL
ncbi:hypothetical protein A2856_00840 [Candidatus Uhrbacteria bacterium RIFCSPHIGHO2_01_FULL_63_20]|uniref:VIT family protein n=1 Tax=Candidatus Uhrbacteria bacterium RIFCSPHIGHO2_01_FULL_63_20 TaxID=1802385 RepID=A0A1F7TM14_9BACT|nr:MAG: hypothetical protein A2856_00840 [Candidatus Uhrbacteria bacterium RIFCSPHIGHO2_01_FULL_63_20]